VKYAPYLAKLQTSPLFVSVPPANVEETAWDILLALHADQGRELSLAQLSSVASVPMARLESRLADLEERQLVTGAEHRRTGELVAALTARGRDLLDCYLSATGDLQVGAHP
jgi:DNA-binding HxlR family transcriptional regulator